MESTRFLMCEALQRSPVALQAACLLSSLVAKSHNRGAAVLELESQDRFSSLIKKSNPEEGDAMAGLHIVSWVLFGGGKGQWKDFLNVACRFAAGILYNPHYVSPYDALLHCTTMERFIIKTSMWFDVLAAATRVEVPFFLDIFDALFKPDSAYFDNLVVPEQLSMLDIMGCESHIVWALAAVSNLACWKNRQNATGHLSMPALVKRGELIERYLMPPTSIPETRTELQRTRLLTSQVFRASARVYLHSVVSGAHPSCTEIKDGVADTISWLERVPPANNRAAVRSVVFSICLCSCLTDDPDQRAFFLRCLDMQDAYLGNCEEVKLLIQDVWSRREPSSSEPVPWQAIMRKAQMLLV
jgi:C6 transcription factor Pro1